MLWWILHKPSTHRTPIGIMAEEPFIAWSIDGGVFTREQIGHNISIPIADTDEHLLWIVVDSMCLSSGSANRNSGWSGVHINSISTDGKMYKAKAKARQILFVGDSIVEGINTLGTTRHQAPIVRSMGSLLKLPKN